MPAGSRLIAINETESDAEFPTVTVTNGDVNHNNKEKEQKTTPPLIYPHLYPHNKLNKKRQLKVRILKFLNQGIYQKERNIYEWVV